MSFQSKAKVLGQVAFPKFSPKELAMYPINLSDENISLPEEFSDFNDMVNHMLKNSPVKEGIAFVTIDSRHVKKGETHRRGGAHTDGNYIIYKDSKPVADDYAVKSVNSQSKEYILLHKKTKEKFRFKDGKWKKEGLLGSLVSIIKAGWNNGDGGRWKKEGLVSIIKAGWNNGDGGRWKDSLANDHGHNLHYVNVNGGLILASSVEACRGWEGEFQGIPLEGGSCNHLKDQLDNANSYILEKNKMYLGNSTFVHESLPLSCDVERSLVRITLPHHIKAL